MVISFGWYAEETARRLPLFPPAPCLHAQGDHDAVVPP